MTMFSGEEGVKTYRAIVLKTGLEFYAKCKMKPNRAWTPTAMLRAAGEITGRTYKLGQYNEAAEDLAAWIAVFGTTGGQR